MHIFKYKCKRTKRLNTGEAWNTKTLAEKLRFETESALNAISHKIKCKKHKKKMLQKWPFPESIHLHTCYMYAYHCTIQELEGSLKKNWKTFSISVQIEIFIFQFPQFLRVYFLSIYIYIFCMVKPKNYAKVLWLADKKCSDQSLSIGYAM